MAFETLRTLAYKRLSTAAYQVLVMSNAYLCIDTDVSHYASSTESLLPSAWFTNVTDGQTDRQTERPLPITHSHSVRRLLKTERPLYF